MAVLYSNNATTSLSSGITNSATSITVSSVSDFPSLSAGEYYFATLANVTNTKIEIVKVTSASSTTLTVVRGQDGTAAVSFDSGDNFQLRVTAATLDSATRTDVSITGGSVATSTITDATASAKGLATAAQITKLDAIEASADVTDTTNVTAAGALMDSELAGIAAVKATTGTFLTADQTKLDGIETSADVTDATNVTAAGALMDSEVTNLAAVKAFATSDYATAAQGTTADNALPKAGGAMTGAITTNSTFDGRDVATDGTKLDGIAASANNYVHPNHSGEVTSTADGATVITDNVVDEANLKADNSPTNDYVLTAKSSASGGLTWTEISSDPSMGGDISGTASNAQIVANAVGTTEIATGAVTGNEIAANTIADSKITGLSSSKLSGSLPALNGSALTSLTSGNLTGALPAISGASLTNLPASAGISASAVSSIISETFTFTPSGEAIVVTGCGGGGGGTDLNTSGGGGCAVIGALIAVTPNVVCTVVVGAKGSGSNSGNASAGGDTTITQSSSVKINIGGGAGATTGANGAGGTGTGGDNVYITGSNGISGGSGAGASFNGYKIYGPDFGRAGNGASTNSKQDGTKGFIQIQY